MKSDKKRTGIYFDLDLYLDRLLKDCEMSNAKEDVKAELKEEITKTLYERINAVVVSSMGEKELFLLQKSMEDHPELDEIDILSIITSYIPGLEEKIVKAVDELYSEIVANVKQIDQNISKQSN